MSFAAGSDSAPGFFIPFRSGTLPAGLAAGFAAGGAAGAAKAPVVSCRHSAVKISRNICKRGGCSITPDLTIGMRRGEVTAGDKKN